MTRLGSAKQQGVVASCVARSPSEQRANSLSCFPPFVYGGDQDRPGETADEATKERHPSTLLRTWSQPRRHEERDSGPAAARYFAVAEMRYLLQGCGDGRRVVAKAQSAGQSRSRSTSFCVCWGTKNATVRYIGFPRLLQRRASGRRRCDVASRPWAESDSGCHA